MTDQCRDEAEPVRLSDVEFLRSAKDSFEIGSATKQRLAEIADKLERSTTPADAILSQPEQPTPYAVAMECAEICEKVFGGPSHKVSENTNVYRAQDYAISRCIDNIHAHAITLLGAPKP